MFYDNNRNNKKVLGDFRTPQRVLGDFKTPMAPNPMNL